MSPATSDSEPRGPRPAGPSHRHGRRSRHGRHLHRPDRAAFLARRTAAIFFTAGLTLLLLSFVALPASLQAEDFVFKTKDGQSFAGELTGTEPGSIHVRLLDGQVVSLPSATLSQDSQDYVREWFQLRTQYHLDITGRAWEREHRKYDFQSRFDRAPDRPYSDGPKVIIHDLRKRQTSPSNLANKNERYYPEAREVIFTLTNRTGQAINDLHAYSEVYVQTLTEARGGDSQVKLDYQGTHFREVVLPPGERVNLTTPPLELVHKNSSQTVMTSVTKVDSNGKTVSSYTDLDRRYAGKETQAVVGYRLKLYRKSDNREVASYEYLDPAFQLPEIPKFKSIPKPKTTPSE